MSRYGIKCFIDPHQDCVSDYYRAIELSETKVYNVNYFFFSYSGQGFQVDQVHQDGHLKLLVLI